MIIKLFKELGRRMYKQSEKLEILTNVKNLNKLENVKSLFRIIVWANTLRYLPKSRFK